MAWTAPPSFSTGELVPASKMQIISDDLSYLLNRPKGAVLRDNGSNYTTTSTSFVDVDATNLKITITLSGSAVAVGFTGVTALDNTGVTYWDIDVDGTRQGAAGTDGLYATNLGTPNASMYILVTGLSTGSHTFKLKWKTTSPRTSSLYSGNGVAGQDFITALGAVEVA
jgi:hypothetical protein